MDCVVRGVSKSWTGLSHFHFHFLVGEEGCWLVGSVQRDWPEVLSPQGEREHLQTW